jgi:hypothetical protein
MANRGKYSRITQALDKEEEVSSPLIYRISRAELTFAQSGAITEEQYAEVEARLKTAIAKKAHQLFASPSFPSELRLQVMKAGVLQSTSCWRVNSYETVDRMRNRAFSSLLPSGLWNSQTRRFNPTWLDSETRGLLANTAKRVFLNNAIVTIDLDLRRIDGAAPLRLEVSPLLEEVGAQIHYLDVSVRVKLRNLAVPQVISNAWPTTQEIASLKHHFPHLKTCVLTIDVHYRLADAFDVRRVGNLPTIPMFDKRLLQSTCIENGTHNFRTVNDAFSELFEVFADEGPGKSRFVRMRSRPVASRYFQFDEPTEEHFSYGPLVKAERIDGEDMSFGARLVDAAYRLERTVSRPPEVDSLFGLM